MHLTMVDGAVVNVLCNNTSSTNCHLCGATPKLMNCISTMERPKNEQFYKYGLSTLHAQIKFFECIIHLSYKLPFKTWRVSGENNKKILQERKESVRNEL